MVNRKGAMLVSTGVHGVVGCGVKTALVEVDMRAAASSRAVRASR